MTIEDISTKNLRISDAYFAEFEDSVPESVRSAIYSARRELKISQAVLADQTGATQYQISRLEKRKTSGYGSWCHEKDF